MHRSAARIISYVFNPLVLPPVLFGTVIWLVGGSLTDVTLVLTITLFFFALLPLVPMIRAVRARPGTTLELRNRLQRTIPYLVGVGSYLVCIPVIAQTTLPQQDLVAGIVICFILNGVLLLTINLYWKISLHVATIAGCFSILVFAGIRLFPLDQRLAESTVPMLAVGASASVLIMMWARVADKAHSVAQVVAGAIFGTLLPVIELSTLDKLGLFDTL